jgi:hypothetical protein
LPVVFQKNTFATSQIQKKIMTSWYQVKIKFQEIVEDDRVKNITEAYLFDAVSYTDAEARAYDYFAGAKPAFELHAITKMKLAEVFMQESGAEIWFKCRVQYIIFDEKTKQEKKTAVVMLINALNIKHAYESLEERLGCTEDYIISDINATKILDVFPYEETPEQKLSRGNFRPLNEVTATQMAAMDEADQVE